jgi:hypothetical protein
MSLELVALTTSAAAVVQKVLPQLTEYIRARVEREKKKPDTTAPITTAEATLEILSSEPKELEGLTPERIDALRQQIEKPTDSWRYHTWAAYRRIDREGLQDLDSAKNLGAFALAISPHAVFQDARRRTGLVFKINLAVSIVLAIILLGGIGGAVFSALFLKSTVWVLVFGGMSAADAIGVYAYKPLTAINDALVGTTRLDALQLRLSQQLFQCSQHQDLEDRIRCQTSVWEAIQHELGVIGAAQSQKNATISGKRKRRKVASSSAGE